MSTWESFARVTKGSTTAALVGINQLSTGAALEVLGQGLIVGAPTGGNKGSGTINVAGSVEVNDSACLVTANDLSEVNAATARSNLGAAALGANTFTGTQSYADNTLSRPTLIDYSETVNILGSIGGGSQDIDITLGNVVTGTVDTSETTFTFSNPSATGTACSLTLILTNGGSQTVNWPASVDWEGGTAPTLTAAGVDVLTFVTVDGGTIWYGFAAGLSMS